MNELKLLGKQNISGYEFTGIEGGFGEGKRAILVIEIAEIHGKEVKEVNRLINNNRKRFIDGVDIIDLLSGSKSLRDIAEKNGWIGSNRTQNVYLLSERGYAKLLKILEDDTAWEIYDQFVDSYFSMRASATLPKMPTHAEALRLYADEIEKNEQLQLENDEMKPKADYFDALVDSNLLINLRDSGKVLGVGQKRLISALMEKRMIYRDSRDKIRPHQRYVDKGYFELKEFVATNGYSDTQTFITPRGREAIRLFLNMDSNQLKLDL